MSILFMDYHAGMCIVWAEKGFAVVGFCILNLNSDPHTLYRHDRHDHLETLPEVYNFYMGLSLLPLDSSTWVVDSMTTTLRHNQISS